MTAEDADDPIENPLAGEEPRRFPLFSFDGDGVGPDGSIDLAADDLTRAELVDWLHDLAASVRSHEVSVEADDGYMSVGVAPDEVALAFDPDDDHRGELTVTVRLDAAVMKHTDDPDRRRVGAHGDSGFIPLAMLTSDRDPDEFRCYNWVEDPIED
ncbi:hypothetical protein ACFQH6_01320 [Halobacteriaceae archaeon GCM10025711]